MDKIQIKQLFKYKNKLIKYNQILIIKNNKIKK